MKPLVAALALGLAVAAFATGAAAQRRAGDADIVGAWRFETVRYDVTDTGGCQMTGTMTIRRGPAPGAYVCAFTATEDCGWGRWSAEQTCTARRNGDQLEVESVIVRVSPANTSYAPDNWSLTIRSADLMVGELRSADIANVEFRRGPAYTS
ncbi:MAG: hypothetical protein NW200_06880 [Hyphomonadaceae bacterium]|nr:hypothetical protein [Hyphomonadaceae bacterium]